MKLRVAVDARALESPASGVGRVLRELLAAARRVDPEVAWDLRTPPRWMGKGSLARFAPLPLDRFGERPDVLLAPANLPPILSRVPVVLVVHDLTFRTRPREHTRGFAAGMRLVFGPGLRGVEAVQVPSLATRRDLLRFHPGVEDRTRVVPYGVAARFSPHAAPGERERLRARHDLPEKFALAVGVREPRKNLLLLARVFDSRPLPPLVLAGPSGWGGASPPVSKRVLPIGEVGDEDLAALYRQASFLAFPSLEEGFGLPPLEAMACGCPVLASDRGAIPEVVGEAGLLVEPTEAALGAAAARLAEDAGLRARLREAGLARARGFTWERCARETLATLRWAATPRSLRAAFPRESPERTSPRTPAGSPRPSARAAPVP